ncbi:MAG TPA: DNA polymerase Y family protein [Verrucomicrobiae bacterium]|jgi:protein ImuB|nr:DNA polymerase Y family protein [Verrucomicrobiae bacterium]
MHAVIYIPNFHLQAALRLEPELRQKPVALIDGAPKATVFELNSMAREAGVAPGQTSTQAMARCRDVVFRARSRAQEQTATEILLQCSYCFSPRIEATADGVCTLDLSGLPLNAALMQHQCNEIKAWADAIRRAMEQALLEAQIGVAETPNLAWHAAKLAHPLFVVEDAGEFISGLPLESLSAPPELLDILERWGIRTTGAFIALGKDKIADRLGPEAVELFELATARQSRPLNLVVPPETFEESMEFEQPVELLEPLLFGLRRFVENLTRRLNLVYLVAGELKLRLGLASGGKYERVFVIPAPTCDDHILFRMMHTHLENVRADSPIQSLLLSAKPARAAHYQFGLFDLALRDPNQFHETLARLSALLGPNRVGTPRLGQTHRPDSFRLDTESIARGVFGEPEQSPAVDQALPINAGGLVLRRFRPPLPAMVQIREERPVVLHSAAFVGAISEAQGPWRISGDWWDNKAWARDEWDVQTQDGGLYRLIYQNDQWFVDGILD